MPSRQRDAQCAVAAGEIAGVEVPRVWTARLFEHEVKRFAAARQALRGNYQDRQQTVRYDERRSRVWRYHARQETNAFGLFVHGSSRRRYAPGNGGKERTAKIKMIRGEGVGRPQRARR